MSVREIALALAEGHEKAAAARALQKEAAERRAYIERVHRGADTLAKSPLSAWFPDADFSIIDYTGVGTTLQYQSDGSDIIVESDDRVKFGLIRNYKTDEVEVYVVKLVAATGYYAHEGQYYSGTRVESALEVGLWLQGRA